MAPIAYTVDFEMFKFWGFYSFCKYLVRAVGAVFNVVATMQQHTAGKKLPLADIVVRCTYSRDNKETS